MPDEADIAEQIYTPILEASIKNASVEASKINIEGSGECLCCNAKVDPILYNGKLIFPRWCSPECRDAWDEDDDYEEDEDS